MTGDVDPSGLSGGTGQQPQRYVPPPDKVRGKHRWIATAMHWLTKREASALTNGRTDQQVHLDLENLGYIGVGCIDCEQPFPSPEPCRAPDSWRTS